MLGVWLFMSRSWSFNYFFYNKNMKKIMYFTCMAKGLSYEDGGDDETMEDAEAMDEDGDEATEDYFGMSPDWYEDQCTTMRWLPV